ncbi:N-acetylglucosaminyldiphosphodolichol N-acetylglucosaminyltransferase anchoring subunit ALG14 [Mycosarcoma maydis]|uniref:UDP-N-acetylglucosamine transferase subunit ALG14 n=1 Tax=Mycosarcoma maydis TaxID=5270 RepID=A0A0D1CJP4_MYCMD|nr:N-acetylglucosaminyldiphosphodolichol N-acetylglucosaminyltransferase anchoring subunit ALG14 [Ustilago maydis 521]KIS67078.1 hypothetical protein UMAG_11771 [Ustilago maydis 521]|eukprot:XP_011391384.1 hypothetical protein UMAG_11771 [Ustilago maydis 521]
MDRLADKLEQGKLYLRRPIHQVLPPSLLLHLVPPLPPLRYILVGLAALLLLLLRVWLILPGTSHRRAAQKPTTHRSYTVAAFLGSGGHTTELLQLVSALPTQRYARRIYLVSSGDRFSWKKANDLERTLSADRTSSAHVLQIPRARNVHQSFVTTPWTLAKSIAFCLHHVALRPLTRPCNKSNRVLADVILMNGPGTCVPIVIAVYLLRVLALPSPKLIYVESFARVKSLSLTAKLIRPFVDRFVLQWPRHASDLTPAVKAKATPNTVYSGWLV